MTSLPIANATLVGTCILRDGRGDEFERVVVVSTRGTYYAVQVSQYDRGGVWWLEVTAADVEFFSAADGSQTKETR